MRADLAPQDGSRSLVPDVVDIADALAVIEDALEEFDEYAQQETDGTWLEDLTVRVAALLRDWNVDHCWRWEDWPDRAEVMPEGTPDRDVGIDLVARRRDDGGWIAIQAKSRKLNELGEGAPVASGELNKFLAAAANTAVWRERWMVVNGAVPLGGYSPGKAQMSGAPVKVQNVAQACADQRAALTAGRDTDACPHCDAGPGGTLPADGSPPQQTRSCMQREAVATATELLRTNEQSEEDGIPRGEARGRIVLPCGTGKTRIALRITRGTHLSGRTVGGVMPVDCAGRADTARVPSARPEPAEGHGCVLGQRRLCRRRTRRQHR